MSTPDVMPEELPVSDRADELIHFVSTQKYRSGIKKLAGSALAREVMDGRISLDEHSIVSDEIAARRKSLTAPADLIPPDVPEFTTPEPIQEPWSPTAILDNLPPADQRLYDHAERAAGEHLHRD